MQLFECCFGIGEIAQLAGRIGAAAGIHAGHIVTSEPDSPHRAADKIKAELKAARDRQAAAAAANGNPPGPTK